MYKTPGGAGEASIRNVIQLPTSTKDQQEDVVMNLRADGFLHPVPPYWCGHEVGRQLDLTSTEVFLSEQDELGAPGKEEV